MFRSFIVLLLHFIARIECSSSVDTVVSDNLNSTTSNTTDDIYELVSGKDKIVGECQMVMLQPGEYELLPNGTLYVEPYNNLTVDESKYLISKEGVVRICFEKIDIDERYHERSDTNITSYMTLGGLIISIICLFTHLVVFIMVPDLKNLPGYNLAALCMSLLCSYILLVITSNAERYRDVCIAVASLKQFFLLSSFMWMSIMSFDVFVSLLRATGSFRISSTQFKLKKFVLYSVIAFGTAFLITLLSLLASSLDFVPPFYKPSFEKMCWFESKTPLLIYFAAPVISLISLNFIFFLLSAYTIYANKMKCDKENQHSALRSNYLMYFRLSVIMGITWIIGIALTIVNAEWLRYLFVFVNTLQGLFIFLAFTCNKKVKKYFHEKYMGGRRPSEFTLSPTFQSYCYYSNSIEKDLDKFVDGGKQNIDTIVIHL